MSDTLLWVAGVTQTVTAIVAISALVVSIISLRLQRLDKNPRLKISGSLSAFLDSDYNPGEYIYMLDVANVGQMPVTVSQIYIWTRRDWKLVFPELQGEAPFPCMLAPGEAAKWWVGYETLREGLRQNGLRGRARIKLDATDTTGGSHKTRTTITLNTPWWRQGWRRLFGNRRGT